MSTTVRVRFAPSPTGSLHVGGARTALYNYLLAKKSGGQMVLRIEDTDQARSTDEALEAQLRDLQWLGLKWDEGPIRQSDRILIYQQLAKSLIEKGLAYHCFQQPPEVEEGAHRTPWISPDRHLSLAEAEARLLEGEKAVVRFRLPDEVAHLTFSDVVRGDVTLPSDMIGDFVLLRADGMPVYNFSCVVDDSEMGITHVLRGEEHLPNTLKQMLLYQALDKPMPTFGHLSIILGEDRKKLSKRQGAVSCDAYRQMGILPEALLNYLALLGWSDHDEREIFSLDDLAQAFDLAALHASAAIFDPIKLKWVNEQHLKRKDTATLVGMVRDYCQNIQGIDWSVDDAWWCRLVEVLRDRWQTLEDAFLMASSLQKSVEITEEDRAYLTEEAFGVIKAWQVRLERIEDYPDVLDTKAAIKAIQNECGVKGKALFVPLRLAVLGVSAGADVAAMASMLTRTQLLERVAHVNALLQGDV